MCQLYFYFIFYFIFFLFIYYVYFMFIYFFFLTCVPKHEPPSHLPPHNISLGHPHAPAPSKLLPTSDMDWRFNSYMTAYMLEFPFSQIVPPSPSESKSPLYTSVSFLFFNSQPLGLLTHRYVYVVFQELFLHRLLQKIGVSFLVLSRGFLQLIFLIVVCTCQSSSSCLCAQHLSSLLAVSEKSFFCELIILAQGAHMYPLLDPPKVILYYVFCSLSLSGCHDHLYLLPWA